MHYKYKDLIRIFVIFFSFFSFLEAGEYDDLIGMNDSHGREITNISEHSVSYYSDGRMITKYFITMDTVKRDSDGNIIPNVYYSIDVDKEDFDELANQIREANQPEEPEELEEYEEAIKEQEELDALDEQTENSNATNNESVSNKKSSGFKSLLWSGDDEM